MTWTRRSGAWSKFWSKLGPGLTCGFTGFGVVWSKWSKFRPVRAGGGVLSTKPAAGVVDGPIPGPAGLGAFRRREAGMSVSCWAGEAAS